MACFPANPGAGHFLAIESLGTVAMSIRLSIPILRQTQEREEKENQMNIGIRVKPILVTAIAQAFLLLAVTLSAQTFRGSIGGSVLDPTGARIVNQRVQASNESTGINYSTETSNTGQYNFQDLPLGSYTVTAAVTGFKSVSVKGVTVTAGNIYSLDLKLTQAAGNSTTIEVSAEALVLDTQTDVHTTTISAESLEDTPVAGRSFLAFASLAPGYAGEANNSYTGSVNGTRVEQVNYQINGTDNNDPFRNQTAANQNGVAGIPGVLFPIDAVDEVSFQTSAVAETGRNPGGTFNLITKSGTNTLHGSAFYYNRNEALAAASPFLPSGQEKPANRSTNWGGSVGGPIIQDRTFYFLSYEKQTFTVSPGVAGTEPGTGYQSAAAALLEQYNVPQNSASVWALQNLWPQSALTAASSASSANYFGPDSEYGFSHNLLVKIDQRLSSKHNLSASWYTGEGPQVAPIGTMLKYYFVVAPLHVQNYSVVLNSALTPRLTNQVQLGADSFNQTFRDYKHDENVQPYFNTGSPFTGSPTISIGNFDPIGLVGPTGRVSVTGHITDALSWTYGFHQLRLGGEFRKVQCNEFYYNNALGTLVFSGQSGPWAGLETDTNTAALADFLAGISSYSSISYGDAARYLYVNSGSGFAQDIWRVAPKLTVTYGLRYDYTTPVHNGDKNISTFVPSRGGVVYQGVDIDSLYPGDHTNFGPRIGFTYQPGDQKGLVIRGGLGIYFDTPAFDNFVQSRSPNNGAGGIQSNPGGLDPVNSYVQGQTTIVPGQSIFANAILNNSTALFAVSQKFKTPRDYTFDLQIEKSLGGKTILQLGYVGLEGRHLVDEVDINRAAFNSNGITDNTTRPYYATFPQYTVINQLNTDATSNYNSLQAVIKTAGWHGLSGQAAYTWSHNLDDSSTTAQTKDWAQDSLNLKGNYGNADSDQRQTLATAISYAVPGSSYGPRWLSHGWTLNNSLSFHSGNPFTVKVGNLDTTGTGDYTQFANISGNPYVHGSHSVSNGAVQWLNTNAFSLPTAGTLGNQRRNQLFGPGYSDVDLSVFKTAKVGERVNAQFRIETLNLFNRANYGAPSATYSTAENGFGVIGSTIGASDDAPGIGSGEPFNVQLGLRVSF